MPEGGEIPLKDTWWCIIHNKPVGHARIRIGRAVFLPPLKLSEQSVSVHPILTLESLGYIFYLPVVFYSNPLPLVLQNRRVPEHQSISEGS